MMLARFTLVPLMLTLAVAAVVEARQQQTPDERALVGLVETWTSARNANDAEAMRPVFAEKVDRVALPTGVVESTTRDELIAFFAKGFKGSAKGTRAKTMKVRPVLLSPTVGIADHKYTMYNPDGSEVGVGHTTFVALKESGTWRMVAVRYVSAWPASPASKDTSTAR